MGTVAMHCGLQWARWMKVIGEQVCPLGSLPSEAQGHIWKPLAAAPPPGEKACWEHVAVSPLIGNGAVREDTLARRDSSIAPRAPARNVEHCAGSELLIVESLSLPPLVLPKPLIQDLSTFPVTSLSRKPSTGPGPGLSLSD